MIKFWATLVHEGCVIMMLYVLQEPKLITQNFIIEPTCDKYFSVKVNNFRHPMFFLLFKALKGLRAKCQLFGETSAF